MIIDFHTHVFSDQIIGQKDHYLNDSGFNTLYSNQKARIINGDQLINAMYENNIDISVVMGFSWMDTKTCLGENDTILRLTKKYPEKLVPFASAPAQPLKDVKQYVRFCAAMGFVGIGEMSFYADGFTRVTADYVRKLAEACAEEDIALCLHVNEPVGHIYPGKYTMDFSLLYKIIKDTPATKYILSHWGGGIFIYENMPEVKSAFVNVWYDTAASPLLYRDSIYQTAIISAGFERILFGSDFPLLNPLRYKHEISSSCGEREFDAIMGNNARALLEDIGYTGKFRP